MGSKARVLVVDDEKNIHKTMKICLEAVGFEIDALEDPTAALELLSRKSFDLAFYDWKMEPIDGMQLLKETRRLSPDTTVVLMTAHGSIESAVEAIKNGAYDYLQKPFEFLELQHLAMRVYEHHQLRNEVRSLKEELRQKSGTREIITQNKRMQDVVTLALQVAQANIAVLIEGESGTGKELLAQLIYRNSQRCDKPFVVVNCAALVETLIESELFGHAKGAFTGANKDRRGRFEMADGGTVFLDEIGEVPLSTQVKLLRFLESKEFERVGENATHKVDVRIIAATNQNLEEATASGKFREDLFYRLNAIRLKVPPLRQRVEDVPLLVQHFLRESGNSRQTSPEALKSLMAYPWKGNVRELENVMERALLLCKEETIQLHHLPEEFQTASLASDHPLSLEQIERQHIMKVLRTAKDLDEAATILGIDPTTLWRKRKKFNL